ncbi:acyl-CoA-binding protein [Mesonia hippocampi]|uniref:Acyl-CoA-binding protein n=1 Tax=Mesonia hippocampi TaxID=1628250 RepID=A0A840EP31_9FLAO|nr:acyl-CoA-binding protein [Mesonia hippocampi]MBB4118821.1 acyl-CoA-binding protein [Mesonia hippocampi]
MNTELDKKFNDAIERASCTSQEFPPDVLLLFYAYYKHALGENPKLQLDHSHKAKHLIKAFKMNALIQVKSLSKEQAKEKYIALVNKYIPTKK